jgi:hypothetical protein
MMTRELLRRRIVRGISSRERMVRMRRLRRVCSRVGKRWTRRLRNINRRERMRRAFNLPLSRHTCRWWRSRMTCRSRRRRRGSEFLESVGGDSTIR